MLIGVSSLPLTKCRQGRARAASRPSAFIGLPDNKAWCLGRMPRKECAVNMSALPNTAFMNMYLLIRPTWQFSDTVQCRWSHFSQVWGFSPEPLQPDLPICFPTHLMMGKYCKNRLVFLMLVTALASWELLGKGKRKMCRRSRTTGPLSTKAACEILMKCHL